ncbi:MAG TPA: hypothetical protein VD706_02775 [Candidatus Saccharimonadales bacterium]|nr:hypothetical protein [Candidatus Saccharimonadales bacterium]
MIPPFADAYILHANPGEGLTFAASFLMVFIVLPATVFLMVLFGFVKIVHTLVSRKVTTAHKADIAKRILIVAFFVAAATAAFTIINAIGTRLIDL